MKREIEVLFVIVIFIVVHNKIIFAQKKNELEKIKVEKIMEIRKIENLLDLTKNDKSLSIKKIELLLKKITIRNDLIFSLSNAIEDVETKIEILNDNINIKNIEIIKLKKQYANIIYLNYYRLKDYNQLIFILSSNSFNQAYRRFNYLKQYSRKRNDLINSIKIEIKNNNLKIEELNMNKNDKKKLLREREDEAKKLEYDKIFQDKLVIEYKKKEEKLRIELRDLQESTKLIEKEIQEIIKEEEFEHLKMNKNKFINDNYYTKDFSENKGKIIWPVEKGTISSYFGEHPHPIFKGIIIKNNGIDISTSCNEEVYAVFNGIVSKVFAIKGANFAIIIRHGNYLTVYQNLQKVSIKIGEKVTKKQVIGYSYCENNNKIGNIHFEIWQELNKLNPLDWILEK